LSTLAKSSNPTNGNSQHESPGDNNRGDVWTDNVGQPPGPGHEQDPHLACIDINLWGARMGDAGGTFAVMSWPPSGSKTSAYESSWHYAQTTGGTQVLAVIPVQTLIANAMAAGASPQNKNGYHFKLDLSQDPSKHKTFWVA